MKRGTLNIVLTVMFLLTFCLCMQTGYAVEEHHPQGTADKKPATGDSGKAGMMQGSGMMGMMGGQGMMGKMSGHGMMGMMDKSDMGPGMGGTPERRMMHMMMAHMTAGPGGMDQMMGMMGGGMMPGKNRMALNLEKLNLTDQQWDKVHSMARENMKKMIDLLAKQKKQQIDLAALRWDQDWDSKQVRQMFTQIAETKADIFITGKAYMKAVKGILTQEQLNQLEKSNS